MNGSNHSILIVDDEKSILYSLNRMLRKEGYRFFSASSGLEAFKILEENDIHLVICDQRMPEMSGTDLLAGVRAKYPDVIRIILSGYTDVDSITESINKGHIYKFLVKPWDDKNLKLEIKHALMYWELIKRNKGLDNKILEQNEELKRINETLEHLVKERTRDLEIQNQALELSRAILEELPMPIVGVSAEGMVAMTNRAAIPLMNSSLRFEVGKNLPDFIAHDLNEKLAEALESNIPQIIKNYSLSEKSFNIDVVPLSGMFRGKGTIMIFREVEN